MYQEIVNLLFKAAQAKEASVDGGNTPISPSYDALLAESKPFVSTEVPHIQTLDDLIRALIFKFEKALGNDIETSVQNAEQHLARWTENLKVFQHLQSLKHGLNK